MLLTIIFFQVLLRSVSSFLIQDFSYNVTSSPHGQATGDTTIRDLMTLIVEEKRIRFQLEDRLNAAENEINKMKQYDVAVSSEMEKESKELERLRAQNQMLSDQLANMTAKNALLESKLDRVSGSYVNMSENNSLLESKLDHLSKSLNDQVMNVTAKTMILESKLNVTLLNMTAEKLILESKIDHLSGGFLNLSSETRRETANISMNVHNMELQIADFSQNLQNISDTFNSSTGVHVGFTVYNADSNSGANIPLKFQSTLYISDDSFNISTGVFTCIYPGLYVFSAAVMRKTGNGYEYSCYFVVNNHQLNVRVFANDDTVGYPSSSALIVLRLNKNDRVNLGYCGGTGNMHSEGVSFTGFRISP